MDCCWEGNSFMICCRFELTQTSFFDGLCAGRQGGNLAQHILKTLISTNTYSSLIL